MDPLAAWILTALISPSILAEDAVMAPLLVTLNWLEDMNNSWATEEAEISNFKKWRELNGEDSTPLLDASAAQKTLAPAIKGLADDIFGAGTYDRIQSI